ncbi:MAG: proprotein convertase P-domain-containing protein [Phycisphaerae bacterium]
MHRALGWMLVAAALSSAAPPLRAAIDVSEQEPNETKATATRTSDTSAWGSDGDTLGGTSTGAGSSAGDASRDFFRVRTASLPVGVYRHRLILTTAGTPGHAGAIMGVAQSGAPSDTTAVQQSSASTSPPRFNQWYGFGRQEQVYYRVTGATATTQPYRATLETVPVACTVLGEFEAGDIEITTAGQGHATDTELFLYDENLNLLRWNDNAPAPATGSHAKIRATLATGTYFVAVATANTAIAQANEASDRSTSGNRLDYPDALARNSSSSNVNVSFSVTDVHGPQPHGATLAGAYDVYWARFEIEGAAGACCLPAGGCASVSMEACEAMGGQFGGAGSACTTPCPPVAACCFVDGACRLLTDFGCWDAGGAFQGVDTDCGAVSYAAPATLPVGFEDISATGATIGLTDRDDGAALVNLPPDFEFEFFDSVKRKLYVSVNGFVSFAPVGDAWLNDAIPTPAEPNDAVYALWDDLILPAGAEVYYETRGVAPLRRFIVQWDGVDQFEPRNPNELMTFQMKLFEHSNCIELHYAAIVPETPADDYTVGVENAGGAQGTSVSAAGLGGGGLRLVFCPQGQRCAQPTGACCTPSGACELATHGDCQRVGGAYWGDGVMCDPSPCGGEVGGCCLPGGSCQQLAQDACLAQGGVFAGGLTSCATLACRGACCDSDGNCGVVDPATCAAQAGTYQGDGAPCSPNPCGGACCLSDGTCQTTTAAGCAALGGTFAGVGSACESAVCTGACCLATGACFEDAPDPCTAAGGVFRGVGSACATANCPQPPTGACCLDGGACQVLTAAGCAQALGSYLGDGAICQVARVWSASPMTPIPDFSGGMPGVASHSIMVDASFGVLDLDVGLLIPHTYQGDLQIVLTSPVGTVITLVDRPGYPQSSFGFSENNFGNSAAGKLFVLDDEAPARYDVGSPGAPADNVNGAWRPDGDLLAIFDAENPLGVWTLTVFDREAQDVGMIASWRLTFIESGATPCPSCNGQARADANCSGAANNFDIDCFVLAVASGEEAWTPACNPAGQCSYTCVNDINGDGLVNNFDIEAFVACLAGACP